MNRRIVGAFLSTILLLVIIVIVGWLGLNDAVRAYDVAVEDEERTAIAYRAEGEFHDARQAFLHYLITPTAEWRTRTDSAFTISNEHLRQLANNSPEGNLRSTFEQALALQGEWLTEARAAMDLVDRGDLQSAVRYQDQRSLPLAQRFVATLQRGAQIQTAQTDSVRALATETAARNRGLLLLLGGLCVIVGLVSAFILSRAVMNPLRRTIAALASSASEILAATTQQAAGTTETMAAVTETAATVDEVAQTSEQASERAQSVSTAAQRAATISRTGREAVDHSIGAMADITQQVETIVGQLRELATQAQAIGDIIVAVDDISDLTNLLALNAAIEAARAGEEGRGFAVVASEIRGLADQSKKATVQVRQILGEIQRASNAAVAAGEQGSRQVTAGAAQIREAGETIRALSEAVAESAQAAVQIAASAGQQSMGMGQIRQAMSSIETVAQQNLAATQQTERAAQDLEAVGQQLLAMVGADGNAVR